MILYHCTTVDPEIVNATPGLIPGKDSWKDWIDRLGPATPSENVIWLTAEMAFVGKPSKWIYTCVIPSHERRLVPFKKILRKAGIDLNGIIPPGWETMRSWYVFFGRIYPPEVARVRFKFGEEISEEKRRRFIELGWGDAA
jgi:hypothetical protein